MFKKILIPIALDHDADIDKAVAFAHRVMSEKAQLILVAVVEDVPSYVAEYVTVEPKHQVRAEVEKRLRKIASRHKDCDVAVMSGKPGVVIPDIAQETDADLVIVGSHRPGVDDYFLGSTAARVVRRAPCPVMVFR